MADRGVVRADRDQDALDRIGAGQQRTRRQDEHHVGGFVSDVAEDCNPSARQQREAVARPADRPVDRQGGGLAAVAAHEAQPAGLRQRDERLTVDLDEAADRVVACAGGTRKDACAAALPPPPYLAVLGIAADHPRRVRRDTERSDVARSLAAADAVQHLAGDLEQLEPRAARDREMLATKHDALNHSRSPWA